MLITRRREDRPLSAAGADADILLEPREPFRPDEKKSSDSGLEWTVFVVRPFKYLDISAVSKRRNGP